MLIKNLKNKISHTGMVAIILFLITTGFVSLIAYMSYQDALSQYIEQTRSKVSSSTHLLRSYHDIWHDRFASDNKPTEAEYQELLLMQSKLAKKIEVEYIYSFTYDSNGRYFFSSDSAKDADLKNPELHTKLGQEFTELSQDLKTAATTNMPQYGESPDRWGTHFSYLAPFVSPKGVKYVLGVDLPMDTIKKNALAIFWRWLIVGMCVSAVGFVFAFFAIKPIMRQLEEKSASLENLNEELESKVEEKTAELLRLNKELEQRVQEATSELQEQERHLANIKKSEALFELLGNLAHHWRQPLNIILFAAQVSEQKLSQEDQKEFVLGNLKLIISEAQSLSGTIDSMTTVYKEYGQDEAVLVDFKSVVEEIINEHKKTEVIQISTQYEISQPMLKISLPTLKYMMNELINNSVAAATASGHQTLSLGITLETLGDTIAICVADDAGGIPDGKLESIFDPYFTTGFKGKNKGLGLHLLKSIIEKSLGGSMVASNTERGARFQIKISSRLLSSLS